MSNRQPFIVEVQGGEVNPVIHLDSVHDTVFYLKELLEATMSIPTARQTLWTAQNVEMMDHKTFFDYGSTCVVRLEIDPPQEDVIHQIKVVKDSDSDLVHECGVRDNDTVLQLKRRIEGTFGAKAEDMTLLRAGKEMKDALALSKYYMYNGAKLTVRISKKAETASTST